jgi:hypothetical protein
MPTRIEAEDIRRRSQEQEIMIYAIGLAERCGPDPNATFSQPSYQRGPGRIPRFPGDFPGGPPGPKIPTIPGLPGGPAEPGLRRPPPAWPPPTSSRDANPCADAGPDPELRTLADEGGGGYFELRGTDNLRSTFARVADELHHQYLLAFAAPVLDGEVHRLDVRVKKPRLTTRARKSYLAR